MARKKNNAFVRQVKGAEELKKVSDELRKQGFVPYSGFKMPDVEVDKSTPAPTWGDFISSQLRNGKTESGNAQRKNVPTLYFSSGNETIAEVEDIGTPELGYIEWGFGNNLPNVVALLTQMLPYTAVGAKFNDDMLAGLGPQPMYDVTQYVGGNITTKSIRYKDAGLYLQGRISDKQRELYNLIQGNNGNNDAFKDLCDTLKKEIESLKNDYAKWEQTNKEVYEFIERNNLAHTWLALAIDNVMFGVSFPEMLLNQQDLDDNGKPVETSAWEPKIMRFSHRSCHTTRLERMDDKGVINHVYCSNRWLDSPFVEDQGDMQNDPIVAIPALDVNAPLSSLKKAVREARQKNVAVNKRPTRFVYPSIYPTAGRPYYPTPAWHSIFGGDIYEYLSTIISDRFTRKKNSNIIGRVIYMNHDYLRQLSLQADSEGNIPKIEDVRDEFYAKINRWLANRNNAGQSLLAFTFQGSDGKEHKSFEVVEIASASKDSADANEKETAEISSIVFMSMGLDARLLGSSPLSLVGSNGGTDIRERFLLRQILMSPTQNIMLKPLEIISRFNEWDEHLVWDVKREVMTTLDRSKSGVTTAETE